MAKNTMGTKTLRSPRGGGSLAGRRSRDSSASFFLLWVLQFPFLQLLRVFIERAVARVARRVDHPLPQRLEHGAPLFHRVGAAGKPAVPRKFSEFRKAAGELLLADDLVPFEVDRRKARRVGDPAVLPDGICLLYTSRCV